MNWDKMKEELDATVRQQSVAVLDEAIAHLQAMRVKLLAGEMDVPPPAAAQVTFVAPTLTPPPTAPPFAPAPAPTAPVVRRRRQSTKIYPPRVCEQCGTEFVPEHHRSKVCNDECRERRAMNRKNAINMTFKRVEVKPDVDEELEQQKQRLAEKFAGTSTRHQPGSNPQSAPRVKVRARQDREPRNCANCGDEFLAATYRSQYCNKPVCKRAYHAQHTRDMRAREQREIQAGIDAISKPSESKPYAEYRQLARRPLSHEVPPAPNEVPIGSPEANAAIELVRAEMKSSEGTGDAAAAELLSAQTPEQQQAWAAVNAALGRLSLAYGIDPDDLNEPAGAAVEAIVTEMHDQLPVAEPIPLPVQRQPVERSPEPPRPLPKTYPAQFLTDKPWGPGHLRYAERTAIRMAIDVLGYGPDSATTWNPAAGSKDELCNAARNLGAMGATRAELLVDLAGMVSLYLEPTGSVRRAVELADEPY